MNLRRLFGLVSANHRIIKSSATSNGNGNWKLSRLAKVFGYAVAMGVTLFVGNSIRADEQGTRHVVIFSTSDYSNHKDLPNLHGNVAEADGFKKIMEKSPNKKVVHLISNGSSSELYLNLEKINRTIAKYDELIVYVTGHGFEDTNNPEPNVIIATKENKEFWIDTNSLIKALGSGNLTGSKKLLIVDTCRKLVTDDTMASASQNTFSGTIIKGNSLQANSHPALALVNGKRSEKQEMDYQLAVIYSCQSDSDSLLNQDRSIFANALRLAFVSTSNNKESISLNDVLEKTKKETIKNARILGKGQRPEIEIFTAKSTTFELDWQIGYEDNQKASAEAKQLENVESNASKRTIADAGRSMQGSRAAVATSAATKAEKAGAALQGASIITSQIPGASEASGYLGIAGTALRGAGAMRRR